MLPKAVEITRARPFEIFWAPWGDVTERVTFGIWLLEPEGVRFPRLWEFSSGGQPDGRVDITRVRLSAAATASDFAIPNQTRQTFVANRRRVADTPFGSPQRPARELAPGIVKVPANWDVTEVRQGDGVVIVEGPLVSDYSVKVIDDAVRRFSGAAIKAVVTTSDSWPHIGGCASMRRGVPIYARLNVSILSACLRRSTTFPDALARVKAARLHAVAKRRRRRANRWSCIRVNGERRAPDAGVFSSTNCYTSDVHHLRHTCSCPSRSQKPSMR